jgi:glyoxylase-like metal-dependent hydrolase (beta-lactamase superfamily II)
MFRKILVAAVCVLTLAAAAWLATTAREERKPAWTEVAPGVWRSPGLPAGYALVDDGHALLIDAPHDAEGLKERGVKTIDAVLLTHHHRDTAAQAGRFLADKVPVRAPKLSAPWLTVEGVKQYWATALPLRNSRTAYLALPEGLNGVDCSLTDEQTIDWRGWTVQVIAAPGHSPDHIAYAVRKGKDGALLLFCGDAMAEPGKMWSPYTTDWDHWTDLGQKPAHETLTKLAALKPAKLLPAHGPVIDKDAADALRRTADTVREVAFLKSFERYTKEQLKDPPSYAFLARVQAESNGSKPWSRISEHLYLTGNTYVLVSKAEGKPFLVVDPWDPHSAKQLPKLKADEKLGPMEVVLCSHAHFDHYDGIYTILEREKPQFWTLDLVATPLADPARLRAPFLDARPVKIDKRLPDGEALTWREYRLRFCHLPGQTLYTMGVETEIDGKKCFFTADNFFHQDQFSGTGGWMGLNRSWPPGYARSAQKVLDAKPDWVLAEHGGAFEFNAEDFRRRVKWGEECTKAADAMCVSGNHRRDWDPSRVHVEPVLSKAKAGATLKLTLAADNPLPRAEKLRVALEGRGLATDATWDVDVPANATARQEVSVKLGDKLAPGRHVFALRVTEGDKVDGCDAFVAVDVER